MKDPEEGHLVCCTLTQAGMGDWVAGQLQPDKIRSTLLSGVAMPGICGRPK